MKRTETELLILNTNFTTLSTEVRGLEQRVQSGLENGMGPGSNHLMNSKRSDSEVHS